MSIDRVQDETQEVKTYYLLKDLVKELEDTRWGSAAFDMVLSDYRHKINRLISQAEARGREEAINTIEDVRTKWLDLSEVHELDARERTVINVLSDLLTKLGDQNDK